jgi:DNA-binding response OmpR family regulator
LGYIAAMRILVVEDQDAIRHMIEALVLSAGHEVSTAANGAKAIDASLRDPPDILLLDWVLSGPVCGLTVCRRLRSDPKTADLPILVFGPFEEESARADAMDAGATAYYTKPFSPLALLKELERLEEQLSLRH